ncbi:methylmalonyl-CoA mutase family protein [Lysinibacillus sp. MHQ-1]|nr:methylmalonyl-CoA mutase family protein [Lysinibacillus sp. MHQ-1]
MVKLASYFSEYSFKITIKDTKDPLLTVFDKIALDQREAVQGFIVSTQPISLHAFPSVRSVGANTVIYHNEGANAIQELAYALALAAKWVEQEESFEAFSKKFFCILCS